MGLQDVMKQQERRRSKEKKNKEIEKEETTNATKTATILWRFLLAIFDYKTGFFLDFGHFCAHQSRLQPLFSTSPNPLNVGGADSPQKQ